MSWLKQNWIVAIIISIFIATTAWLIFYEHKEIYLYAWERPEDFSFLKENSDTTVVFYAGDIVIKDGRVITALRRNSLSVPENIKSFPLIRIDSFDSPSNLISNTDKISEFIIKICGLYEECQIDFEARTSEYDFYLGLMDKIRTVLPDKKISVTALASWCSGNTWLSKLPIDTAIPMLYRMGKDASKIKSGDIGSWFLSNSKCSDTIALSVDEFDFNPRRYMRGKSVYLFNPEPWNKDSYKKAREFMGK